MIRINLVSSPRNLSTALMYSFGNRADTTVLDEPLYAAYLTLTGKDHPGRDEVLATQDADAGKVLQHLRTVETGRNVLFIKNMAHHVAAVGPESMQGFRQVFLIRHPAEMIASFSKVIETPVLQDVGVADQWFLWEQLKGQSPLVVHADDIRKNPQATLTRLCEAVGISFDAAMLAWPKGPKPFDGCWAPYWYAGVHASTGFNLPETPTFTLTDWQASLLAEAMPYYEKLNQYKL